MHDIVRIRPGDDRETIVPGYAHVVIGIQIGIVVRLI